MKFKTDNQTLIAILLVLIITIGMVWVGLGQKMYQNEQHLYKIQAHTRELTTLVEDLVVFTGYDINLKERR